MPFTRLIIICFLDKFSCVALTSELFMSTDCSYALCSCYTQTSVLFLKDLVPLLFPNVSSSWCFTGCCSTPLLVPGAAAQRRLPGGRRGGELAERPEARSHQTLQPANTQQAAGTQTLAHHTAAHPGQTQHPLTPRLSLCCSLTHILSSYHSNVI